jgi:hypothetical protein
MKPSSNTVASVGIGTPVSLVLPWILKEFFGREVPYEVAVALGSLIATAAGYVMDLIESGRKTHATTPLDTDCDSGV